MRLLHGSGKTAVLVERIINKVINKNIDIDKILVVTFTNAAASEMRARILDAIYKKLEEDEGNFHLQRQITLLNKASISTIHAFCLDVIKNNFYEIGVSANFRIGDTTEVELLKQEVLEELFEQKYINHDKEFIDLINMYTTYKGDEPLKELILSIYKYIQSTPEPEMWLKEKVELLNIKDELNFDFARTEWGKILINKFAEELKENRLKLEKVKEKLLKYPELEKFALTIQDDINQIMTIENLANSVNEIYVDEINSNEDESQFDEESFNKKNLDLWNRLYNASTELKFTKWPTDKKVTIEYKEQAKKERDNIKGKISKAIGSAFVYDSKAATQDINFMYKPLKSLSGLVIEFSKMFAERKKEKNIIDFNDIEHFALNILLRENEPTEVAKKYREKFEEILVDEYQDSNLVQEYILKSISKGNNIFMVGDVKQSIYKFRQARPELFLDKYEKYKNVDDNNVEEQGNGKKIKLFKNFRSRENILDVTNLVFKSIMSKKLGDIEYNEEEYLNLGANYKEPEPKIDYDGDNILNRINYAGNAELHIIDLKKEEEDTTLNTFIDNDMSDEDSNTKDSIDENEDDDYEIVESTIIEARFVADKIQKMINSNYQVFDKNKKEYRRITYKDIVILLRTTSSLAPIYEKELNDLNIPVFSDTSSEYLGATEIETIMSLLKIIDNPLQDIPLVTVMRSEIGGFTDNDLVEIRLSDKRDSFYDAMIKARLYVKDTLREKINKFIQNIERWRDEEKYKSLDELIWQIYIDTNYYNYVGLLQNGKLKQANLKMLFQRAKQYETASFKGLFNFINFIDKLKTSSTDMSAAKVIGENENVVRIMSIHKSKGLEFPVVFLCGTGKQFNMQDLKQTILLHQDLGFGPDYINFEKRIKYATLAKEALKIKTKQELISEEMRVLYVALTRAKEKLIITGVSKQLEKDMKEKQEQLEMYENELKMDKNLLKKYISYLDWLELIYLKEKPDCMELYTHKEDEIKIQEEKQQVENVVNKINEIKINNKKEYQNIEKLLNWKYGHSLSTTMMTKTSVTNIKEMKQNNIIYSTQKEKLEQNDNKIKIENVEQLLDTTKDKRIEHNVDLTKSEDTKVKIDTNSNEVDNWQVPKFMKDEKITSAQKGTLMHLCVQKLNEKEEYNFEKIKKMVEDLKNREIITEAEMNSISIKNILNYTQSKLYERLKKAKSIKKEEPFYINISSKEILKTDENENILVQGIIDLYFIDENDKLVLVDYKTDYIESGQENILKEKYTEQLELYKKALEKSLNKKVDEMIIYSLYLQKEIKI